MKYLFPIVGILVLIYLALLVTEGMYARHEDTVLQDKLDKWESISYYID